MGTSDYIILIIICFFTFVLYSVYKDEQRKSDRRQQSIPHPVERRQQDRREKGLYAYLAWVLRTQWSKLTK